MVKKEDFAMLKALYRQGVYHKDFADESGIHPRTVRRGRRLEQGSGPVLIIGNPLKAPSAAQSRSSDAAGDGGWSKSAVKGRAEGCEESLTRLPKRAPQGCFAPLSMTIGIRPLWFLWCLWFFWHLWSLYPLI